MRKIIQRFGASFLRHIAGTTVSLQVAQATNWASTEWRHQVVLALVGGVVGPLIRLFTDTADYIDPDQ